VKILVFGYNWDLQRHEWVRCTSSGRPLTEQEEADVLKARRRMLKKQKVSAAAAGDA
jgi:hypothetical protein